MAQLRVTSRCNQRCVFCSYPAERYRRAHPRRLWARELRKSAGGLVQISGGEPLLRPARELVSLLRLCARRGIAAEFQTNGVLLEDLSHADLAALVAAVAGASGCFNVNVPSHLPGLDARLTGAARNFAKRERGVRRLLDAGASVRITHVVTALNFRHLPAFVSYVKRRFGSVARLQFSFVKGVGRAGARPEIVPAYGDASAPLTRALRRAAALGLAADVDHIPICYLDEFWTRHVDVRKVLGGADGPHRVEKRRIAQCADCGLARACSGPRVDYLEMRKPFSPVRRPASR